MEFLKYNPAVQSIAKDTTVSHPSHLTQQNFLKGGHPLPLAFRPLPQGRHTPHGVTKEGSARVPASLGTPLTQRERQTNGWKGGLQGS